MSSVPFRRTATALAAEGGAVWVGTSDGLAVAVAAEAPVRAVDVFAGSPVVALALWGGGAQLIAGDAAGRVAVHDAHDGSRIDAFQCAAAPAQVAIAAPRLYVTVDVFRRGLAWTPSAEGPLSATAIASAGAPVDFDAFGVSPDAARLTLLDALRWHVWDRAAGTVVATHAPIDGSRLAYLDGVAGVSPNGAFAFIYWDESWIFDAATGALRSEGPHHGFPSAAMLRNDGRLLVTGDRQGRVLLLDQSAEPRLALQPTAMYIRAVVIADGVVAWLDAQGGFGLIDPHTGAELIGRARGLEWLSRIP